LRILRCPIKGHAPEGSGGGKVLFLL